MKIRWITPMLGTAAASEVARARELGVIDVRDLVDKAGNRSELILQKIQDGVTLIKEGRRTVVCCDYGMSRSNAVAAGILSRLDGISLDAAVRRVREATGEAQIKVEPLAAVRAALGGGSAPKAQSTRTSVLVTGGSGFLGRALRAAAGSRLNLFAPPRAHLDLNLGATDLDTIAGEAQVECIVHLANPRVYTSNAALGETLIQLRNVLDVCLGRDIRLVFLSGWEIYSGYSGRLLADESTPALPRGPYGETKYLAEMLIEHCRRTAGLRCALLRSSPVYGEGSDRPKFIHNFLEKARQNQRIVTHRYRNGDPALDLLHVEDLVGAVIRVLELGFVGTLNLGTGVVTSTPQIAKMICAHLGSTSRIESAEIDADVASISMNAGRAHAVLNWQPAIAFQDGFDRLLRNLLSGKPNGG